MESLNMEPESFQQLNYWLVNNLEPISDADPVVLAKYVIALIQKDKPEKHLRQKCLKQLEIFLGHETASFVDLLFDSIRNKSYMNAKMPQCLAKDNDGESQELTAQVSPTTTTIATTDAMATGFVAGENQTTADGSDGEMPDQKQESVPDAEYLPPGGASFLQQKKKSVQNRIKISFKSFDDPAKSAMIANPSADPTAANTVVSSSTLTPSNLESKPSLIAMVSPSVVTDVQEVASSSSAALSKNDAERFPKLVKTNHSASPRHQSSRHRHHRHRKYDDSSDDGSTWDEDDESDREDRGRRRRSEDDSVSNDSSTESDKHRLRQSTRRRSENETPASMTKPEVRTTMPISSAVVPGRSRTHQRNDNLRYHGDTAASSHGRYRDRSRDHYSSSVDVGSRSNHRTNRYQMSSSRDRYNRDDYHGRSSHHYRGGGEKRSVDGGQIRRTKYIAQDIDERILPNDNEKVVPVQPINPGEPQSISVVDPTTTAAAAAAAASEDEDEDTDALHDQKCPELAEKGFCDKGLYCSYNSKKILKNAHSTDMNSFLMEPYNPETSIDPSMLMQFMPSMFPQHPSFPLTAAQQLGDQSNMNNIMLLLNHHQAGNKRPLDAVNNGAPSGGNAARPRELLGVLLDNNSGGGGNKKGRFRGPSSSGNGGFYNNNRYSNFQRNNNIDLLDRANINSGEGLGSDHQTSNENFTNSRYQSQNNSTIITTDHQQGRHQHHHNRSHQDSEMLMMKDDVETSPSKTYIDPVLRQQQQHQRNNNNSATSLQEKSTLVIRKIPHHLNTVGNLNKHFSKFGTVVYIQVCYQNDPEAAMIQFMNYFEATKAIRSTEAVFNNRFIKVYWAYPQDRSNKGRNQQQQQQQKPHYHHGQQRKPQPHQLPEFSNTGTDEEYKPAPVAPPNTSRFVRMNSTRSDSTSPTKKFKPDTAEATPPIVIKSISSAERFKTMKALNEYTKSLNEKMINQKILLKKIEQAKTAKDKAAILKLGEANMKSIEELKQNILKAQEILKPTLRTTKINNKPQHQQPAAARPVAQLMINP